MQEQAQVLVAGVMSGTSADGVDVALVRVTCDLTGDVSTRIRSIRAELLAYYGQPNAAGLRSEILALRAGEPFMWSQLVKVGRRLTLEHSKAVKECLRGAGVEFASNVDAIADHGQTFFHDPPDTVQWLDPSLLAAETGLQVISDFRRADCAAGGQGAPLVPFADYVLFRHPTKSRVFLNIGGIANLTYLPANGGIEQVIAADTGPGNCISDALVARSSSTRAFDEGGTMASTGKPVPGFVDQLLLHPYFTRRPPKSTDRPEMIRLFDEIAERHAPGATLPSLLYASCELTARSIAVAIRRDLPALPDELFVSGGGVENATMMRMLSEQTNGVTVRRTDELGIASQAKEATAFAIVGAATLWGLPSNVPSATGASRPVVLGNITPRQ